MFLSFCNALKSGVLVFFFMGIVHGQNVGCLFVGFGDG